MTVQLSVADVRAALARAASTSGADVSGTGESSTMLLGRLFHEVFADLVSADPSRSGLKLAAEGGDELSRTVEQLLDHTWQRLLAPRLLRNGAVLQASSNQVMMLWRATQNLVQWLGRVVTELIAQDPGLRGRWEDLGKLLEAEVPLSCELKEPSWTEAVALSGIADSVVRVPGRDTFCAIELKLGRAAPPIDLGQATLYHLILSRSRSTTLGALALLRFSPELEEQLIESHALTPAVERLLELIGRLAGVLKEAEPANIGSLGGQAVQGTTDPVPSRYSELGRQLVRAYKEYGIGIEVRDEPAIGPRFLRFDVRLKPGMRLDGLRRRTREVQHRLELKTEPLVVAESGHLYVDLERPDPATILFSELVGELPEVDPLYGSSKLVVGVDAARNIRFTDLGSSGCSHVLAAGTTGSGKSEWLRMMLASLIATNTPETLRIVTFDPKLAAFTDLEGSSFLWRKSAYWIPGDGRAASELFQEVIEEMDRRYQLTRQSGADDLRSHVTKTGRPLPRIVCVCDEYFALISQNKQEKAQIEEAVALLGAKARASGIHLVLATQQPSRATISGAIQANLPCRVALSLSSPIESNMILGVSGAERLTGSGDLLYKDFGGPVRLQAPYLPGEERRRWFKG